MKKLNEVNELEFNPEVLQSDIPVLVDFWADWCLPCHQIAPIVEDIANEKDGSIKVFKLNIDENPRLAKQFHVMSIPTLILFEGGEERVRIIGVKTKQDIVNLIDNQ